MSLAHPHLVFHNLDTRLGQRVTSILKFLFPVPTGNDEGGHRVVTFFNENDFISFRHHHATKVDHKSTLFLPFFPPIHLC